MLPATHHKPRWVETMASQYVQPNSEERSTEKRDHEGLKFGCLEKF